MGRPRLAKSPNPEEIAQMEAAEPAKSAISKADMVRAALAAGAESPGDGVEFIKSNYGIVMDRQIFSNYKAQNKAREAKQAPVAEPAETVSKAEAVRRAVAAGVESAAEGAAYVQEHFGIDMDNKTFSLNRSQQKARAAKQGDEVSRPGRKLAAVASPAPVAAPTPKQATNGDIISDIEAVRHLIDKHGVEGLKRLADALGCFKGPRRASLIFWPLWTPGHASSILRSSAQEDRHGNDLGRIHRRHV